MKLISLEETRQIEIIDHIFHALDWKYVQYPKILFSDEHWKQEDFSFLQKLLDGDILGFSQDSEDIFDSHGEYLYTSRVLQVHTVNTLKLFEYKRELL